ncbi:MAG: NADH-quinone oxidoreductase subunit N [Bacteriovoracaceae bacterium]|nr:NADH-quinone oxidoreductase subunit N [Bacteriovoracaceae bacterium]
MSITELFPYIPFTDDGLFALVPLIILGCGGTLSLMLAPLEKKGELISRLIAMATLLASAITLCLQSEAQQVVGGVLLVGAKTSYLMLALHVVAAFALFLLSGEDKKESLLAESSPLVIYALCGMCLLISSHHLLFQFIAIEIMSLAIYVLVTMRRTHKSSAEAGMKYFILGSIASATFLYGSALIYGSTGFFTLPEIALAPTTVLKTAGFVLVIAGLLFKVGAVPFHGWVPDVYEGSSLPVTGFMAAAVKFAAFTVLANVAAAGFADETGLVIKWILTVAAALTMAWGNFAALTQRGLKRLLAYSSVAHTGYLIVGVIAAGATAGAPVALYLIFYAFATLGAFACLQTLAPGSDDVPIEALAGRGLTHPFTSAGLTLFLFGMAGIPMTAGFIGKYLVFGSGVTSGHVPLVVLGVLTSVAAVYYYLRIVVSLYMKPVESGHPAPALKFGAAVVTLICMATTIYYGLAPANIISFFEKL